MSIDSLIQIGLGRMGCQIARNLPEIDKLQFIEKVDSKYIQELAKQKGAVLHKNTNNLPKTSCIILALNPNDLDEVVNSLTRSINYDCILINISTSKNLENLPANFTIVNLKIIGEADVIEKNNLPAIIIPDHTQQETEKVIRSIFNGFGIFLKANTEKYEKINKIVARETILAIQKIIDSLSEMRFPDEIIRIAIKNVMAGTSKGYPWSENDKFIQNLLQEMQMESIQSLS